MNPKMEDIFVQVFGSSDAIQTSNVLTIEESDTVSQILFGKIELCGVFKFNGAVFMRIKAYIDMSGKSCNAINLRTGGAVSFAGCEYVLPVKAKLMITNA